MAAPEDPEAEPAEPPDGLTADDVAAFQTVQVDGPKLAAAVMALLPCDGDGEERALVSGDGLFPAIGVGAEDAAGAAAAVLGQLWGSPGAEANKVPAFRREGCDPEPVEPEPEPLPVPSVFGPGGGLDLSVVNSIVLDFHGLQHVIEGVRERRVAVLRKTMESSMGAFSRPPTEFGWRTCRPLPLQMRRMLRAIQGACRAFSTKSTTSTDPVDTKDFFC